MDDLAKKMDTMTVKELREVAKEMGAEGVSGMKKDALLAFIRETKGITEVRSTKTTKKKSMKALNVKELKKRIVAIKSKRTEALEKGDKRMATVYKRQISRLKKRSRKVALLAVETG